MLSKLALRCSFHAATSASTTVTTAHSATTTRRWLKIIRSSALPELRSNSESERTTGVWSREFSATAIVNFSVDLTQGLVALAHGHAGGEPFLEAGVGLVPGGAAVDAAVGVAAQPIDDHRALGAGEAEVAALVGRLDGAEAPGGRVEPHHKALLADDKHFAARGAHAIEVKGLGIVGAMQPRIPALAAVGSVQDQVEGADDEASLVIREPHVQEGVLGALRGEALGLLDPFGGVVTRGARLRLVVRGHHAAESAAVELLGPGRARIGAVQHHPVVAHRPALLRRREAHRDEVRADRDLRLAPALAMVIG